jgi:hypothetical protein
MKVSQIGTKAQNESDWIGTELNMKAIWIGIRLELIMKMSSSGNIQVNRIGDKVQLKVEK